MVIHTQIKQVLVPKLRELKAIKRKVQVPVYNSLLPPFLYSDRKKHQNKTKQTQVNLIPTFLLHTEVQTTLKAKFPSAILRNRFSWHLQLF